MNKERKKKYYIQLAPVLMFSTPVIGIPNAQPDSTSRYSNNSGKGEHTKTVNIAGVYHLLYYETA